MIVHSQEEKSNRPQKIVGCTQRSTPPHPQGPTRRKVYVKSSPGRQSTASHRCALRRACQISRTNVLISVTGLIFMPKTRSQSCVKDHPCRPFRGLSFTSNSQ